MTETIKHIDETTLANTDVAKTSAEFEKTLQSLIKERFGKEVVVDQRRISESAKQI